MKGSRGLRPSQIVAQVLFVFEFSFPRLLFCAMNNVKGHAGFSYSAVDNLLKTEAIGGKKKAFQCTLFTVGLEAGPLFFSFTVFLCEMSCKTFKKTFCNIKFSENCVYLFIFFVLRSIGSS